MGNHGGDGQDARDGARRACRALRAHRAAGVARVNVSAIGFGACAARGSATGFFSIYADLEIESGSGFAIGSVCDERGS